MKKLSKYHIGMRTIKTALAVVIGLYLSYLLKLDSPIFTSLASITTMQPSFTESFDTVKKRVLTCIIGVILGYLLSQITYNPYLTPLIAGAGVILTIWILQILNLKPMISLSLIVFLASFLASTDKLHYAFNRLIGTFLGALVSVVVNYLISSPKIHETFYESLAVTYGLILSLTKRKLLNQAPVDLSDLEEEMTRTNSYFNLMSEELSVPFYESIELKEAQALLVLVNEITVRFELLKEFENQSPILSDENKDAITEFFHYTVLFDGNDMDNKENTVYNFHISKILNNIVAIEKYYIPGNKLRRGSN